MSKRRICTNTEDLFAWQPTEVVKAYEPVQVRAASLEASIAKAISTSLKECLLSRAQVAQAMSAYLGEEVTENMLNAYASEARSEHNISVVRLLALIHATGDRRLLQLLADRLGYAVIEVKYLPFIELAQIQEKEAELKSFADAKRRQLKAKGVL